MLPRHCGVADSAQVALQAEAKTDPLRNTGQRRKTPSSYSDNAAPSSYPMSVRHLRHACLGDQLTLGPRGSGLGALHLGVSIEDGTEEPSSSQESLRLDLGVDRGGFASIPAMAQVALSTRAPDRLSLRTFQVTGNR